MIELFGWDVSELVGDLCPTVGSGLSVLCVSGFETSELSGRLSQDENHRHTATFSHKLSVTAF